MYSSSSALLLLYTPQRLKAGGLALINVFLSRRREAWATIRFVIEACKDLLHWLLQQGLLSCKPLSIPAAAIYVEFEVF
jgi:hypothetical protein